MVPPISPASGGPGGSPLHGHPIQGEGELPEARQIEGRAFVAVAAQQGAGDLEETQRLT